MLTSKLSDKKWNNGRFSTLPKQPVTFPAALCFTLPCIMVYHMKPLEQNYEIEREESKVKVKVIRWFKGRSEADQSWRAV